MHVRFELSPRSRRHDLDKALAFAIAPAAPTFAAIYFFAGGLALATIVTAVCLVGTFLCALTMTNDSPGRLALSDENLVLDSGCLHARIPIAELDFESARVGDDPSASPRLVTRPANAITIPRRQGPAVVVSPLDPRAFLRAARGSAA